MRVVNYRCDYSSWIAFTTKPHKNNQYEQSLRKEYGDGIIDSMPNKTNSYRCLKSSPNIWKTEEAYIYLSSLHKNLGSTANADNNANLANDHFLYTGSKNHIEQIVKRALKKKLSNLKVYDLHKISIFTESEDLDTAKNSAPLKSLKRSVKIGVKLNYELTKKDFNYIKIQFLEQGINYNYTDDMVLPSFLPSLEYKIIKNEDINPTKVEKDVYEILSSLRIQTCRISTLH